MRADRLVAIVLLLQAHGQLTVAALAERLEASERTIRRDLEALSGAGVPVYAQRGRGGGWALLGGHRIDLSGLTAGEAQALVLATKGAHLGPGLEEALRKVMAALPAPLRQQVDELCSAVLVDRARWGRQAPTPGSDADADHLDRLRRAVLVGVQLDVTYARPGRPAEQRRLHPHGLVCKRGVWYLLATAAAGLRTYRVSRIQGIVLTDEPAERPSDFDLAEAWAGVERDLLARIPPGTTVELLADPPSWRRLQATIGAWWAVEDLGPEPDGRRRVSVNLPSAERAAAELAALGEGIEVLAPNEVRSALAAIGRRLQARYEAVGTGTKAPAGTAHGNRAGAVEAGARLPSEVGDASYVRAGRAAAGPR